MKADTTLVFGCLLYIVFYSVLLIDCHVQLIFPPARKYALDFLDNQRTVAPCGMPKGIPGSPKTTLVAGSTVNISWKLAYPNVGGFTIDLRNSTSDRVTVLAAYNPIGLVEPDYTITHWAVQLPDEECLGCFIRILREAEEWQNTTQWSCGDVDIVDPGAVDGKELCSQHGRLNDGSCDCDELYSGDYCQYKDECKENSDCGPHGKCLETYFSAPPKFMCFCERGWFGTGCLKESPVKTMSHCEHTYRMITSETDLYWRILQKTQEIEVILHTVGKTWLGVGWRPGHDSTGGTELSPECRNFPPLPHYARTHADTGYGPQASPLHAMDCTDMVIAQVRGNYSRVKDSYTRDISSPREDEFFDGQDSLTAALAYEEEWPDGFTSTWLLFRKKLVVTDRADHNITDHPMHVIWAVGQTSQQYTHVPNSGLEIMNSSRTDFYPEDELKYHGRADLQRGALRINFISEESGPCYGSYRYPFTCDPQNYTCDYYASWQYSHVTDDVQFTLRIRNLGERWTGIGYSRDRFMNYSDAVIAWITEEDLVRIVDSHIVNNDIIFDESEDIYNITRSTYRNVTTFTFARKMVTHNQDEDQPFRKDGVYMFYPVSGGGFVNKEIGKIGKHYLPPEISLDKVCIGPCAGGRDPPKSPDDGVVPIGDAQHKKITRPNLVCQGTMYYPSGCRRKQTDNCEYVMKWKYSTSMLNITFNVTTKQKDKWTGVGFSNDKNMIESDAIIGYAYDDDDGITHFNITNRWISNKTQSPSIDANQSTIYDVGGSRNDKFLRIWFTRDLDSGSEDDLPFGEDYCYYVFIPYEGGSFNKETGEIRKHKRKPIPTAEKVCFTTCPEDTTTTTILPISTTTVFEPTSAAPTAPSTTWPTDAQYDVGFKLDQAWDESLADETSQVFKSLKKEVEQTLTLSLQEVEEVHAVIVQRFTNGSVDVQSRVLTVGGDGSVKEQIESTLQADISSGTLGNLSVVADSLSVSLAPPDSTITLSTISTESATTEPIDPGKNKTVIYGIVAAVAFVGVVLIGVAIFVIWRKEKRARELEQKPGSMVDITNADDWGTNPSVYNSHSQYTEVRSRRADDNTAYNMFSLRPRPFTDARWLTADWPTDSAVRRNRWQQQSRTSSDIIRRHSKSSSMAWTESSLGPDTVNGDNTSMCDEMHMQKTTSAEIHQSGHPTTVERPTDTVRPGPQWQLTKA